MSEETMPVCIHFEDGSVMDADHVIITVSLAVLKVSTRKTNPALFNPPLPSCKRTSNVLLAWFADEEALELECLSDEEIIKCVSDTLTSFRVRDDDDDRKENRDSNGVKESVTEFEAKEKINGIN
ncbi:hypothetical protein KI387_019538 [Taxus chinensis]|uniref:Amine oxidase domain-containing protein n=1 Tax=Taxus chinensis TaxID=29808 RepID=A0AA38G6K1_TAXCH|nr:hypothetical protein KI387_019538 [Taxus chinensis]